MTKTYRIRTTPGDDKNIRININQDFDFLEILSLKLRQDDVYTRFCADYGVVVGRVITNGGYGIPNVNVSVFVPLTTEDENDQVISTLYPYKTIDKKNEDGYRYNLLPYKAEYGGHTPTGTFPDREDVLKRSEVLEVYEKYYKYTVKTNDSGDFMIIGVPLGQQTVMMDLDLSNIGCFSLSPSDLIRLGIGAAGQFNGQRFKSSTDLDSLPQIVNQKKEINVTSFWGENELCDIGITRVDFDLRDLGIEIKPQAIFMGSMISSTEEDFLKSNCKPKKNTGNLCDLTTGAGKILAIRQTIDYDTNGQPILEQFNLPEGGNVIDGDGAWLVEVPMNLDYVITDEFGNQIISNDPTVGIPTKGKYRFRIQYQNEDGINNDILRADYLVPNIREYGWNSNGLYSSVNQSQQLKSYAFSLDWNDYADPQAAIDCEDYFYEFNFNKVYTIANFIDRWKWGYNRSRHLGIKEITDRACTTTNNRFPVNDGVRNFDFIFFLNNLLVTFLTIVLIPFIPVLHVIAFLFPILKWLLVFFIGGLLYYFAGYFALQAIAGWPAFGSMALNGLASLVFLAAAAAYTVLIIKKWDAIKNFKFKAITLPMMSFPDCEACPCESSDLTVEEITGNIFTGGGGGTTEIGPYTVYSRGNNSFLADVNSTSFWSGYQPPNIDENDYTGSDANARWIADQTGVRYAIAGYQDPASVFFGFPLQIKYSPNDGYTLQNNITLSQSLNLMNLRTRYFDSVSPNIIQTTVINQTAVPSTPFTDNVMILLCDTGIASQLASGSVLSFNNPNNIIDNNLSGVTIQNQFGSNSITGQTSIGEFAVNVPYITYNGNPGNSIVYLTGDTDSAEYKFKTGVEYFQVITGMTLQTIAGLTTTTNSGYNSILRRFIISSIQSICYKPDGNTQPPVSINPLTLINNWQNLEVVFLNRGVDVWTKKQQIRYDLSKLFGYPAFSSNISVSGEFYMNVPIQVNSGSGSWYNNPKTPEAHTEVYSTSKLYHKPFDFKVNNSEFTAVTTNSIKYYSSLDKSNASFTPDVDATPLGFYTQGGWSDDGVTNQNMRRGTLVTSSIPYQGIVEGGSIIATSESTCTIDYTLPIPTNIQARVYSPTYIVTNPTLSVNITYDTTVNNAKLIIRSDRLPTSDITQSSGDNSFLLHQNDNFNAYIVDAGGSIPNFDTAFQATDVTNNSLDISGDTPSFTDSVLSTFNCEGMVPLSCYDSTTDSNGDPTIQVLSPCNDNIDPTRVVGGCYKLVTPPFIVTIPGDYKYLFEWKARFRFMFGACRGLISHVFQNNWVNGTLYMFTFKKQMTSNILGQKKFKFCGTADSIYREGQGPIYYTDTTTNSFFYRSAPYDGTNFVGQIAEQATFTNPTPQPVASKFKGMNDRNLFFPTTIMDLGPRDQFTKEICNDPSFQGYIVDTVKSTSFNDTADILQLAFISRLMNNSWLSNLVAVGDASINQLFSRSEFRLDGDIAQLLSINSEYGVEPFSDDTYGDNDLFVQTSSGALVGIFFSSNTINRKVVSPGVTTFSSAPPLVDYYGFPNSQRVPMYKWLANSTSNIFGSSLNDWETTSPYYSSKYQDLNFSAPQPPAISPYFNDLTTGQKGYIYNSDPIGPVSTWPASQQPSFIVGAPYHFYFGLRKGKSAINKYITKYFLNQDV
jgi:hypothetical protein